MDRSNLSDVPTDSALNEWPGATLFCCMCIKGNLDFARWLAKEYSVDVKKAGTQQSPDVTPLMIACQGGHLNIVKWFVQEYSAEVERTNEDGYPLFWYVCAMGQLEVAQWLAEQPRVNAERKMVMA